MWGGVSAFSNRTGSNSPQTGPQWPRPADSRARSRSVTKAPGSPGLVPAEGPVDPADPFLMRTFTTLDGWADPANDAYQGLLMRRPREERESQWFQRCVDKAVAAFGGEDHFDFRVSVVDFDSPDTDGLATAASQVLAECEEHLPKELVMKIRQDIHDIGTAVLKMMEGKASHHQLVVKLEAFGKNGCSKWHKDRYVGRAITAYCGAGTEFTPTNNIDWTDRCCLPVLDAGRVYSASAGDVLFIKGSLFPSKAHSLIHKSPAPVFHRGTPALPGPPMHRLLLKVDLEPVEIESMESMMHGA